MGNQNFQLFFSHASTRIPYSGYHTVKLDSEIGLQAGQKFSVVLKLTTPDFDFPIAIEEPITGYSRKAAANAGESFVSQDGDEWEDITKVQNFSNTNVCIKAFTDSADSVGSGLPVADFSSSTTYGYAPLTVQFTDLTEKATSRTWDFGDGNISTEQNPTHKYSTAGNYTVKLTVSNPNGINSKLATIVVSEKSTQVLPDANFIADVIEVSAPLTVHFTDLSTGSPTTWEWDFGDGASTTGQNVSHTYTSDGSYTVSLTVTNTEGSDVEV